MANSLQEFLTRATASAREDLEKAFERLPEDKRTWQPMDKARSAADQVAECAILNGANPDLVRTRKWDDTFDMEAFQRNKSEFAQKDWETQKALLRENTAKSIAAIRDVRDEDLGIEVQMPWGAMTLAQIISYPFWNMCYHEGQINYIASMLGCLD